MLLASEAGHRDTAALLIRLGANSRLLDDDGRSVLSVAATPELRASLKALLIEVAEDNKEE